MEGLMGSKRRVKDRKLDCIGRRTATFGMRRGKIQNNASLIFKELVTAHPFWWTVSTRWTCYVCEDWFSVLMCSQLQTTAAGVGQLRGRHLHPPQAHWAANGAALQGRIRALLPAGVPGGKTSRRPSHRSDPSSLFSAFILNMFRVSSGWSWCWAGWAKCLQAGRTDAAPYLLPVLPALPASRWASLPAPSWSSGGATCTSSSAGSMSTWGSRSSSVLSEVRGKPCGYWRSSRL